MSVEVQWHEGTGMRTLVSCVIGTRPEAIKMAPVVLELGQRPWARSSVVLTAQHRHLVDPLLAWFGITADHDLDAMQENQTLAELTSRVITRLSDLFQRERPDIVLAQGDTTTVLGTALACFYLRIPFGHVEAGLRSGTLNQPFPEEFNRIVADRLAAIHFAPTEIARATLVAEGVATDSIHLTGNTVIDALLWTGSKNPDLPIAIGKGSRVILMTLHRRENFGKAIRAILGAVRDIVLRNPDVEVIYPVHPNPNVRRPAHEVLGNLARVHLTEPLPYPALVAALKRCHLVITDSGGIQEEAPAFGKPTLVTRDVTERPEAIAAGVALLVGTDPQRIILEVERILDRITYRAPASGVSPYGDGSAARQIGDALEKWLTRSTAFEPTER